MHPTITITVTDKDGVQWQKTCSLKYIDGVLHQKFVKMCEEGHSIEYSEWKPVESEQTEKPKRQARQKFPIHSFVRVGDDLGPSMEHFDKNFDAIVAGSSSQLIANSGETDRYEVYKVEDGKAVSRICWYKENQLTLLPHQDTEKAALMAEDYNMRKC